MTLGELLIELRNKYKEVSSELEEYIEIPEVESFLKRRGDKLRKFENEVKGYKLSTLTGDVKKSLKKKGVDYKVYGICSRKKPYFDITKKVKKAIEDYQNTLLREAYEMEENQEEIINFDKDYAIPDELNPQRLEEMFVDKDDE